MSFHCLVARACALLECRDELRSEVVVQILNCIKMSKALPSSIELVRSLHIVPHYRVNTLFVLHCPLLRMFRRPGISVLTCSLVSVDGTRNHISTPKFMPSPYPPLHHFYYRPTRRHIPPTKHSREKKNTRKRPDECREAININKNKTFYYKDKVNGAYLVYQKIGVLDRNQPPITR